MKTYIDIHTHSKDRWDDVLSVHNLYGYYEDALNMPYCSIGIHPWHVHTADVNGQFLTLEQFVESDNVLAIGECGLDKVTGANWDIQNRVFELQVDLANRVNKPLIIHCVKAYSEVLKMLSDKKVSVPVLFHGFNKKIELAEQIIKQGYYLSFGAALLPEGSPVCKVLAAVSADRFFLETDDSGADIKEIYQSAAAIRKSPSDALILQLQKNFETVFKR